MSTSVIVVDDNVDSLGSISDYLDLRGFDILGCGRNGLDAVQLYEKHTPDVVLLDLNMPVYDGLYGLEHIKKINSHAKVIILTGFCNEHDEKLIKLFKVTEIIEKPCSSNQLEKFLKLIQMIT
jgi:two-component system, chemotaxis family, chemotaxis protein CheY